MPVVSCQLSVVSWNRYGASIAETTDDGLLATDTPFSYFPQDMILRRSRKLLLVTLLAACVVMWDTALGPESGYWRTPPMRADPPKLSPRERPLGSLRVLFIGNSFTRYWGGQVLIGTRMATSWPGWRERPPIYEQSTGVGMDLQEHWHYGRALERIREGNWDFVVLQEHSEGPLKHHASFVKYATLFDGEIKKAGAKTVLFMTWAKAREPQMQPALATAYETLGRELGVDVVPVGIAFQAALKGRPGLKLHDADGKHPSPAGSYLTACCFYSYFYGRSPIGLSRTIYDGAREWLTMNETDALYLQELSYQTRKPSAMRLDESR